MPQPSATPLEQPTRPPLKEPPASSSAVAKLLVLLTQIAAAAVPLLYVFGRVFSDSYWLTLGQSASLLAHEIDDYLYYGFIGLVTASAAFLDIGGEHTIALIAVGIIALAVATSLVTVAQHVLVGVLRNEFAAIDRRLKTWREDNRESFARHGEPALAVGLIFFSVLGLFLVTLITIVGIVFAAEHAGTVSASSTLKRYNEAEGSATHSIARVHLESRPGKSWLLLECAVDWCVVFEAGRFISVPAEAVRVIAPAAIASVGVKATTTSTTHP